MELIRRFAPDRYAAALESWDWLADLPGKQPRLSTAFGDLFLEGEEGFWFLDTVEGTLTHRWPNGAALQADINTPTVQAELLLPDLAAAATEAGIVPEKDQILAFKVPPILGGPITVANLEPSDFVVSLNIAGQIHRQVKDLPPGSTISGVTVDGR